MFEQNYSGGTPERGGQNKEELQPETTFDLKYWYRYRIRPATC